MAARTRKAHAIVLAKTKLRESDLIVKMVDERGSLIEAVAKGARKPSSANSARLELLNEVEVLLAEGKSLDIIQDARLVASPSSLRSDPVRIAAASMVAELSLKTAQRDLEVERFFDLDKAAIVAIDGCPEKTVPIAVAAYLLKATSILGFRPSMSHCPICGAEILCHEDGKVRFSYASGGVICENCSDLSETTLLPSSVALWCEALIRTRFADIYSIDMPAALAIDVLQLSRTWAESQLGVRLKSASSLRIYLQEEM